MTRRKRSDSPGTWHHVMNRGVGHRTLFESRPDVRYFLSRLARAVRRGEIEVHAWCTLTTHFHLLVRSPRGRMDEAMRRTQHEYSRWFNRKRGRDGPLYRSRFTSRVIDTLDYRRTVVRYIDANPLHAGLCSNPAGYRHGSAWSYAKARGPAWMSRDWIESEVCRAGQTDRFSPSLYATAFPILLSVDAVELVQRRLESSSTEVDPLEDLLGAAPAGWLEWLWHKTEVADGTRPGLPLAAPIAVLRTMRDHRPGLSGLDEDARLIMQVDLLRELGGASFEEIAGLLSIARSSAFEMRRRHVRRFRVDANYAAKTAEQARRVLRVIHGRDPDDPIVTGREIGEANVSA